METITSRNNEKIITISKLKDKKYRDFSQLFFAEGRKLFGEAVDSGMKIRDIFCTEEFLSRNADILNGFDYYTVTNSVLEKLSENQAPEGIFFTAEYFANTKISSNCLALPAFILCSVRDPGNVGTIIRSSLALGVKTLILSSDCADIYNSKTIRASMGGLFRQNIVITDDLSAEIENIKKDGIKIYAAVLDNRSVMVQDINIDKYVCFAVGNEGNGIPKAITDKCSGTVFIPMEKGAESLNVSSAATLLMWEQYTKTF